MFFEKVLSFLFPKKCIFCKKYGEVICDKCIKRVEKYETIKVIKLRNKKLDYLIYFFKYEKIIRKLILQYKFFNRPIISEMFSKIILKNKKICGILKFYDIIIPVPMHKNKKCARGYNQTELFSKQIADKLWITYNENVLIKIKDNTRQSSLNLEGRTTNVKNVFKIIDENTVKGKNIILIDDIYTTGVTLEECTKELKRAGAKTVLGLVIAKD